MVTIDLEKLGGFLTYSEADVDVVLFGIKAVIAEDAETDDDVDAVEEDEERDESEEEESDS